MPIHVHAHSYTHMCMCTHTTIIKRSHQLESGESMKEVEGRKGRGVKITLFQLKLTIKI